ncbi:hypothetical protein DPEC_G00166890 [Dallia pectoralis]|uniref:Uncharacterized protein n=1 Tax=Dallia pectoralis TaxID=75939 RepID=A0ACC2GHV9_DALPE|nr:hypothetical protein DPEC_G00166890 [Dallia pectoralis]
MELPKDEKEEPKVFTRRSLIPRPSPSATVQQHLETGGVFMVEQAGAEAKIVKMLRFAEMAAPLHRVVAQLNPAGKEKLFSNHQRGSGPQNAKRTLSGRYIEPSSKESWIWVLIYDWLNEVFPREQEAPAPEFGEDWEMEADAGPGDRHGEGPVSEGP